MTDSHMFRPPGLSSPASIPATILYHLQLPPTQQCGCCPCEVINIWGPRCGISTARRPQSAGHASDVPLGLGHLVMGKGKKGLFPPERFRLWSDGARSSETSRSREVPLHWPEPQVMLRCAKVGVRKCGCHPADLLLWPQLPSEGTPLGARLARSPPCPPRQGPRDQALPLGFAQAAVTTQLSAMA